MEGAQRKTDTVRMDRAQNNEGEGRHTTAERGNKDKSNISRENDETCKVGKPQLFYVGRFIPVRHKCIKSKECL